MSIIIKLRKNINNEEQKIYPVAKTICKLKQHPQQDRVLSSKSLLPVLQVPRPLSTFIKSAVELKLALTCPEERCLGGLRENPCTYNYKVCRVDQYSDLFLFSLEQYDKEQFSKQQVCEMIKCLHDQYSEKALECVESRFKILDNFKDQTLLSEDELIQLEKTVQNYPFQCTIQNVSQFHSTLSQRILNQKFLNLMGITKDMMFDHLQETQALPTIFNLDGTLKNWCELATASVEGREYFDFYLNTYEGQQFKCQVEQKQIFKQSSFDSNQIIFIEFRIIHADPKLIENLSRSERILKNHQEYFNLKNSDLILNQFKTITNYLDAKDYKITKPCGHKKIDKIIKTEQIETQQA